MSDSICSTWSKLEGIKHLQNREKFVDYMYGPLEKNAGLIEINGEEIARTSVPYPSNEIEDTLEDLLDDRPAQDAELGLMGITGGAFAKCLSGNEDALRFLFGSVEVRTLMTNFYAKSALFRTVLKQLLLFFEKIGSTWPKDAGPLRILEVGAGTGGTT